VLDVETTGFSHHKDEIVELGIALFRYDRAKGQVLDIAGEYSGLREPSCPVSRSASAVHGLTRHALRGHRLDYRRIRKVLRQADFVVAHCGAIRSRLCGAAHALVSWDDLALFAGRY